MSTVRFFAMPPQATRDRAELVFASLPLSKENDFVWALKKHFGSSDPTLMPSVGFLQLLFIDPRLEVGHPPSTDGHREQIMKSS